MACKKIGKKLVYKIMVQLLSVCFSMFSPKQDWYFVKPHCARQVKGKKLLLFQLNFVDWNTATFCIFCYFFGKI